MSLTAGLKSEVRRTVREVVFVFTPTGPTGIQQVGAAAAYLMGSDGAFITGSDLLIDGGVIAAMRAGRL